MEAHREYRILHIDMDAFYPAVEVLDDPSLRGKPVIVGARPPGRGVVASASYEARVFGVHSAMPVSRAYQLCPQGMYQRPRMSRYVEVSQQIRKVFLEYTPLVEPLSLDEAFLDVSAALQDASDAVAIGREIKRRILDEIGLVASVGVSHNKFLAKLGSDLEKPDGFTLMPLLQEDIEAKLAPMSVRAIWGVGPQAESKLLQIGIRTIADLQQFDAAMLRKRFGNMSERLQQLARGLDNRSVSTGGETKSISAEHTFSEDTDDVLVLEDVLRHQVDEITASMRRQELVGRVVTVKIRFEDFSTLTRQVTIRNGLRNYQDILEIALKIFHNRIELTGRKVRLIGVGVSKFAEGEQRQMELFEDPADSKAETVDRTLDKLRVSLGKGSIIRGSMLRPPE